MGIVTATVAVEDDQIVPAPVQNVLVRVYSALDVFLSEALTDVNGEASFLLNGSAGGDTYIVRVFKAGVTFPSTGTTFTISVLDPVAPPQSNIFDVLAHIVTLPESAHPNMCKLSGYFVDLSLRPIVGLTLEFKPIPSYPDTKKRFVAPFFGDPHSVTNLMLAKPVKVQTNKDGFVEVELPRTGHYEVHIHGLEHPLEITNFITVPDQPGFMLLDVLFPFVVQVVYGTDPINVGVGEAEDVTVQATMSNLQVVDDIDSLREILEFSVADSTKASVNNTKDGILTVTGIQLGSTTVVATRKDAVVARRVPPVAALIVTPPTVNVT